MTSLKRKGEMDWANVYQDANTVSIEFEFWHEDGTVRRGEMKSTPNRQKMMWWTSYSSKPTVREYSQICKFPEGMLYDMLIEFWGE